MKTIFRLLIFFQTNLVVFGQITTREVNLKEVENPLIYDSCLYFFEGTNNYQESININNLKQFIGQSITILPIAKTNYDKGYKEFFKITNKKNLNIDSMIHKFHGSGGETFEYKVNPISFSNKVFEIIDADITEIDEWYLKLSDSIDTLYYVPVYNSIKDIPFVVNGYLYKSKIKYIDKIWIPQKEISTIEINSAEKIVLAPDDKWKCKEITFVDLSDKDADQNRSQFYKPVLVLSNSEGKEIIVSFVKESNSTSYFFYWLDNIKIGDFYSEEEWKINKQ